MLLGWALLDVRLVLSIENAFLDLILVDCQLLYDLLGHVVGLQLLPFLLHLSYIFGKLRKELAHIRISAEIKQVRLYRVKDSVFVLEDFLDEELVVICKSLLLLHHLLVEVA